MSVHPLLLIHLQEEKPIAKISVTSPIVINKPTRELLAGETKSSFVWHFQHLNNKNNVCKQISSLLGSQETIVNRLLSLHVCVYNLL